ncbi:MAG: NADH dehydrogenase [Oscillospiraceae bacterium]|nr:NADH dehydrogenase [Oscillospiraceae bacterium]
MNVFTAENFIAVILLLPLVGAFLCLLFSGGRAERALGPVFALLTLAAVVLGARFGGGKVSPMLFGGAALSFDLGGFGMLFAVLGAFMWLACLLSANDYFKTFRRRHGYGFFSLFTLFATTGFFLANDLFTAFIFFEMMSLASYTWVVHDRSDFAMNASRTYLAVGIFGGMAALMGLFILYVNLGTLSLDSITAAAAGCENRAALYAAGCCVLAGFGAKAGMFPLQFWMPKSYVAAPAPSTALLSGILSKTGVMGIICVACKVFAGNKAFMALLLALAVITMVMGAVMALLSTDLKRTLACSSMSQIGFILVGVAMMCGLGDHGVLAAWGVASQMVNHSLIKMLLFTCSGIILCGAGSLDLNRIRGYGRNKPLLLVCFIFGALAVGGIPGFAGYAGKTLLHEAIVEYAATVTGGAAAVITAVEWIFLISGGLTIAYMTKLFVAVFVEKGPGQTIAKKKVFTANSVPATLVPAAVLLVAGLFANRVMGLLTNPAAEFIGAHGLDHSIHFFAFVNLKGFIISAVVGIAVYFGIVRTVLSRKTDEGRKYKNAVPEKLDMEELFIKPVFGRFVPRVLCAIMALFGENMVLAPLSNVGFKFFSIDMKVLSDGPDAAVVALRNTVFKDLKEPTVEKSRYRLLYRMRLSKGEECARDAVCQAQERENTGRKLSATLSFSLLLSFAGICAFIIYIFIRVLR